METYSQRKKANKNVAAARDAYENAIRQREEVNAQYYKDIAECIKTFASGAKNAKPAGFFAKQLSNDKKECHSIATTIGEVANISRLMRNSYGFARNGVVDKHFRNLCRDEQKVTRRYAEVDENGNIIGPIKERKTTQYVYYAL